MTRTALAFILLLISFNTLAQSYILSGRSFDAKDNQSLIGVTVVLTGVTDTNFKTGMVSDFDGNFEINNLVPGKYLLQLAYVGYKSYQQTVDIVDKNVVVGLIKMKTIATELKDVTIKEKQLRAMQNGDTSQFNASAYKTNPDATAEDLVAKMPGVTSDNTGVKVNGETVQQIYVDGKPFFGTDPSLALKNMPAEIIDKIQVFDKLSDQSTFTGFDDGSGQKTINIITKRNMSQGTFGKAYAGYGTDETYTAGGNISTFKGDKRISLIGMSNNINQQNFSADDVLGVTGSSGGQNRGGGGRGGNRSGSNSNNFMVGQQGGITTTNAIGFNYTDNLGKKIKFTGSYFFNSTDNNNSSDVVRNYFTVDDTDNVYHEVNNLSSTNINHRANLRFEYNIDSSNSVIFTPGISLQKNNSGSGTNASTMLGAFLSSQTVNNNAADNMGYNSSNNLLLQHKFQKPRRTISLNISSSFNEKTGDGAYYSSNNFYAPDTSTLRNQHYDLYNSGYSVSPNVTFTEPIGKKGQIMATYNPSLSKNSSDKETFDTGIGIHEYTRLDTVFSNKYNTIYTTHKGGLSYRMGDRKLNFNFGANVQYAMLIGSQQFPNNFLLDRSFTNVLPNATFNYRYADGRNLRVMYRTNTSAPGVNQLQNLLDISNPLLLKTGNASLKQTYEQTFIVRYGLTKAKTAHNFFVNIYANYVNDYIANSSIIPDAPYAFYDSFTKNTVLVNKGSQLTRPINMNGYVNTRSFVTYGLPVSLIKSNLNLNGGFNYTRTPGQINGVNNFSNNYTPSFGLVLSSNFSEKLDFTLSYTGNYNIINNTSQQVQNNYYNHLASFKVNWLFLKHFVVNTSITDNYYTAFSSTGDQRFLLWNAYVGYKFLKSKVLEARITAFDLLNQNKSINRTVTETYIENNVTQVLQQYFMFQLTYTIRSTKGPVKEATDDENDHRSFGERGR